MQVQKWSCEFLPVLRMQPLERAPGYHERLSEMRGLEAGARSDAYLR